MGYKISKGSPKPEQWIETDQKGEQVTISDGWGSKHDDSDAQDFGNKILREAPVQNIMCICTLKVHKES